MGNRVHVVINMASQGNIVNIRMYVYEYLPPCGCKGSDEQGVISEGKRWEIGYMQLLSWHHKES